MDVLRLVAVSGALALAVAACTDTADTTTSAPPPATDPATTTTATTAPTPTTTTSTLPPTTTTTEPPATTTTTIPTLVAALPEGPCDGIGVAPAFLSAEISFVVGDRVYSAAANGSGLRCVVEVSEIDPLEWGPAGDRLLAGATPFDATGPLTIDVLGDRSRGWTHPTGKSLYSITEDGRLVKGVAGGGGVVDMSFLARHDEAVYFPSGTHLGVVGEAEDGSYGIWLVTNTGTDERLLVSADDAGVTREVNFTHDGLFVTFIAEHDGTHHVHEVPLIPEQMEFDATVRIESARRLSHLEVSAWDPGWLAVQEGECGDQDGINYLVEGGGVPDELAGVDTSPIGWLPGARLVVASYPDGCAAGTADLWLVDFSEPGRAFPAATRFVAGASAAAVRAPVPPPPPPPDPNFAGFA